MSVLTPLVDYIPRPALAREGWLKAAAGGVTLLGIERLRRLSLRNKKDQPRRWLPRLLKTARNLAALYFGMVLYYYRDPHRDPVGSDPNIIYAPVDGKIVSLEETDEPKYIGGRAICLTIQLNPLMAQVHRSPVAGQLRYLFYENEGGISRNYLGFSNRRGLKALLVQSKPLTPLPVWLSGKRPASVRVAAGMALEVSQKIGVSGLGTACRAQLFFPVQDTVELLAHKGQMVKAGMTVLGRFKPAD